MYPSKILLFGEYSILLNSSALAIPFNKFNGELVFMEPEKSNNHSEHIRSNQKLNDFLKFLYKSNIKNKITYDFDFKAFEDDLRNGLYFRSNIPEESGLGSSGAVVAAVFERYCEINNSKNDYNRIRECMSLFESFFHGTSSGVDPLISYLKSPVLMKENEIIISFEVPIVESLRKYGMFLLHSRQVGNTGNLVKYFKKKCKTDSKYLEKVMNQYIPVNESCINSLTDGCCDLRFYNSLRNLTSLQLELFDRMITSAIAPLIRYGLENDLYYLKLCGSGGGGYFLGFTDNIEKTETCLKSFGYPIIIY